MSASPDKTSPVCELDIQQPSLTRQESEGGACTHILDIRRVPPSTMHEGALGAEAQSEEESPFELRPAVPLTHLRPPALTRLNAVGEVSSTGSRLSPDSAHMTNPGGTSSQDLGECTLNDTSGNCGEKKGSTFEQSDDSGDYSDMPDLLCIDCDFVFARDSGIEICPICVPKGNAKIS